MPYRRPDQYYIDLYDRESIAGMKAREKVEAEELAAVAESDAETKWDVSVKLSMFFDSARNYGVARSRERRGFIRELMTADERMDRLIAKTPVPKGVECWTCKMPMSLCGHFFDKGDAPILFVFECPNHHTPKRMIYPDGREYVFPKQGCRKCGFEVTETTRKLKTKLVTRYNCPMCGESWKWELALAPKEKHDLPVTEEDRIRYCLSFEGKKTHWEELEAFAKVVVCIKEGAGVKYEMETSGVDKIVKLTIPELESRLVDASIKGGFVKFGLEKPAMKRDVRVPFAVQDPKRGEKESVRALARLLKRELFPTNWRLAGNITYRLGYLSGVLKAFETHEDLVKLAKKMRKGG